MTDLGRDARALVARVKRQDGPTTADRARLRSRLEPAWAAQRAESFAELPPEIAPRVTHGWMSWMAGLLLMSFGFVAPEAPRMIEPISVQPKPIVVAHAPVPPAALSGEREQPIAQQPTIAPELTQQAAPQRASRVTDRRPRLRPTRQAPPPSATSKAAAAPTEHEHEHEHEHEALPSRAAGPRQTSEPSTRPSVSARHTGDPIRSSELAPSIRSHGFAPQPIDDELTWLSAAQEALRNNKPSTALRLVQEHAFRFPQGALASERVAVQALALCALSRKTAAREVVSDLERRAPSSPLLARVRRNCGF